MRKMMLGLALLVSGFAYAEKEMAVFPQVYNFGTYVQVQVWNNTANMVRCSGQVYMNLSDGTRESQPFYDTVWARGQMTRSIRPRSFNTRVTSVSHSVFCF